jgi:GT2 family glycosyltransferase
MFEMNRFWDNLILPIIERVNAKYIVEIGSDNGINTRNILEYCKNNDAHMTAVDPFPKFDINKFKDEYGDKFEIYKELSIKRLPLLKDYDVILLDGDHNWYTVYNELKIIEKSFKDKKFPLIFLHDVNWPYARRDLYYNPENIPEDYRQPYKKLGMYPGQTDLKEKGGLNADLNNSVYVNNPHNGVLTALEEFIDESNLKFSFESIDAFHGLGILHIEDDATKKIVKDCIKKAQFLKIIEEERVKSSIYARDKKTESELLQERSKETESKLKRFDELIKEKDNTINSMKEAELIAENRHKELNLKIEDLESNFCEMSYFNNNYRSFTQRLSSKFPSLYILLKMNRRGLKNTLTTIKGYKAIKKNNLLDIGYYLKNNEDVKKSGADPILHYISHGFKEDRKPNPLFDGSYYLKSYADVRNSNLNPLIHYSLYGIKENRNTCSEKSQKKQFSVKFNNDWKKISKSQFPLNYSKYSDHQIDNILNALNSDEKVSIIIPIYNAYEDLKKCINSVLKNTTIPYEMILIDDCSPDKKIKSLLNKMGKIPHVKVIHNEDNKGFVKSINIGIINSKYDVVLLNSDTIVSPKWLQKLIIAAYSNEKIGTVTPFSNASDISVPEIDKNNELPDFLTFEEMASLVEKVSLNGNIEAPTGNGYCMFLKRETINDVGLFDEKNFGKGYGEETDFSMRAKSKNWKNVRNDSIFIYHKRNASFSSEKSTQLKNINSTIVKEKYPDIMKLWEEFLSSTELQSSVNNIKQALNNSEAKKNSKKKLLYVTDINVNGFPNMAKNFKDQNTFDCIILTIEKDSLKLWKYEKEDFLIFEKWEIELKDCDHVFKDIYFNLLIQNVDALFIHNFPMFKEFQNNNYFTFINIGHDLGLPILYKSATPNPIKKLEELFKYEYNDDSLFDLIDKESKKIDFKKNRMVVYTAITGDYDELQTPTYINKEFDYVCFTDNKNLKSDFWEIRLLEDSDLDKVRKARRCKILPHLNLSEYDYSLWVDGNIKITGDLKDFINKYSKNNHLMCFIHEDRNCIYKEANECVRLKKDSEETIISQMEKYKSKGYPGNNGLIWSGVLFRKHNDPLVIKLMNEWYEEVNNHSKRDQLSFNYVAWKNGFEYDKCDRYCWRNEYFEVELRHKNYNRARIFIINDETNTENVLKTINSIQKIDKNLPLTILSSKKIPNILKNASEHIEASSHIENVNYNNSKSLVKKINELIKEKSENFILFVFSGEELNKGAIEALKNNYIHNKRLAAIILDDNLIKSNNDKISRFKPGFSPDYYLEHDYINNAVWINRNLLLKIGGFNEKYKRNYIRDSILRLWEESYEIIKEDLVGLTASIKSDLSLNEESERFIKNTLNRRKVSYKLIKKTGSIRPSYDTKSKFASIIIPFKDQAEITKKCVDSILELTEYHNYEIILINNNSSEEKTERYIKKIKENNRVRVFNYYKSFNYSKINNFAVEKARGNVLVFLNNDTEIISKQWLTELIGDSIQPGVGAVGGLLYYPDETLQHAGVVIGLNGLAGHLFGSEKEASIPSEWIKYRRNVSAVTGACMAINRDTFVKLGGFDENFEITGSDVEICLRLLENGYRNIVNPAVKLYHHEKKTRHKIRVRDRDIVMSEIVYNPYLKNGDPYFNKNYSLNSNKLSFKEESEYPIFQKFLDEFHENHNTTDSIINPSKEQLILPDKEVLVYDVSPLELEKNLELMTKFKRDPKLELNQVLWFVPFFDHVYRGGIYTIFRTAQHFSIKEGTKNIFVLNGSKQRELDEITAELEVAFPKLNFSLIILEDYGNESDLPYSDAAFCTLWTTAYNLVKYNKCKAKFYFNQDFEPIFYPAGSVYGLIEQSYRFGFIGIANTLGVAESYKKYNKCVTHFTPTVDKNIFYPDHQKHLKDKIRVVFYGRPNNPRNGFRLGIEALKLVKSHFGDNIEIVSVGSEYNTSEYGLEGVVKNLGLLPTIEDVAKLYRSCDVGLVFMFTPHPSYQPLEYMASGCATVTNINEGNTWILRDKENVLLTEPTVTCVADNIINLLENENLRSKIINNGLETVSNLNSWETELDNLYFFLKNPKIELK